MAGLSLSRANVNSRARYFRYTALGDATASVNLPVGTLYVYKGTPQNGWDTTLRHPQWRGLQQRLAGPRRQRQRNSDASRGSPVATP